MTDALPILYSFRRCPYAMRARMALLASDTRVELREVALRSKPKEMIAASPKATVPVLLLPGGEVIDESVDIMRWALDRHDPHGLRQGEDMAVIGMIDGPFKHHLDRYKYSDRHAGDPQQHRASCLALLERLEIRLGSHAYLCGPALSLTDLAAMPFVRQFAAVDRDWFSAQELPRSSAWLDGIARSALFVKAMVRTAPWKPGDEPYVFSDSGASTAT